MAFTQGQTITATELNNTNGSISKSWSWGHAGWSWVTQTVYFYVTKPSGGTLTVCSNSTSWGNQKKITIRRLENGTWVQKNYSDTASGTKTISWPSYGPGAYQYSINHHNNTPSLTIYPCTTNCVKGELLTCISDWPTGPSSGGNHTESTVKAMSLRARGTLLTTDLLNHGAVYTTAS